MNVLCILSICDCQNTCLCIVYVLFIYLYVVIVILGSSLYFIFIHVINELITLYHLEKFIYKTGYKNGAQRDVGNELVVPTGGSRALQTVCV